MAVGYEDLPGGDSPVGYENMMGVPMDVRNHPSRSIPDATQHYAGDVVPFPKSMKDSDTQRVNSGQGIDSGRIKPRPAKILQGPGAN